MCIFKALHRSPEEQYVGLSLEEFYHFYEVIDFKWNEVRVLKSVTTLPLKTDYRYTRIGRRWSGLLDILLI